LLWSALLIGAVGPGCTKVCDDDGFAWQQDPACLAQLSITATESATDPTETASAPTGTETPPTTTQGEGGQWCTDADMDGFGDPNDCTDVPPGDTPPPGTVDNDGDCDDQRADTFPGAAPLDDPEACMQDADGDDWGDETPDGGGGGGGGVVPGSDCDDASDQTFPGSAPNDDPEACMKDEDGDDWGDADPPSGDIDPGTDCDDLNMNAWESCGACTDADGDGWLVDCDSYPPEFPGPDCADDDPDTFPGSSPNDDPEACMTDADDDDWGDATPSHPNAEPGTDCDDDDAATSPGSAPKDDPDACMTDADGDDHGDANPSSPDAVPGSDCFDANPDLNPENSVLLTAPLTTGEFLEVDVDAGTLSVYASVDVTGINPWIPTSVAVNPVDGSIVAALAFRDRLYTLNYCGAGVPTPLPAAHKKNVCGLAYDRDGVLYGIDGQVDQFLRFEADGSLLPANVMPLTFEDQLLNVADCGMAFDCHENRVLVSDSGSSGVYTVNLADGSTTRLADLPGEAFGSGLEYDPTTRLALSSDQTSLLSISLDGTNDFTQLPDLESPADDLFFGPRCN
jgi:hypothetical protein